MAGGPPVHGVHDRNSKVTAQVGDELVTYNPEDPSDRTRHGPTLDQPTPRLGD